MGIQFLTNLKASERNKIVSSSENDTSMGVQQELVEVPEMPFEWIELQLCQLYNCTPNELHEQNWDTVMAHVYLKGLYDKTHYDLPKNVSPYIAVSMELLKIKGG